LPELGLAVGGGGRKGGRGSGIGGGQRAVSPEESRGAKIVRSRGAVTRNHGCVRDGASRERGQAKRGGRGARLKAGPGEGGGVVSPFRMNTGDRGFRPWETPGGGLGGRFVRFVMGKWGGANLGVGTGKNPFGRPGRHQLGPRVWGDPRSVNIDLVPWTGLRNPKWGGVGTNDGDSVGGAGGKGLEVRDVVGGSGIPQGGGSEATRYKGAPARQTVFPGPRAPDPGSPIVLDNGPGSVASFGPTHARDGGVKQWGANTWGRSHRGPGGSVMRCIATGGKRTP